MTATDQPTQDDMIRAYVARARIGKTETEVYAMGFADGWTSALAAERRKDVKSP